MSPLVTAILVLLIIFVSTLVRATLGFGNALLAMPLAVLLLGIATASPLVAFVSETIALLMLVASWQHVNVKAAWRLVLASVCGIPVGVLLLRGVPEQVVTGLLGLVLIAFGLYNVLQFPLPALRWKGSAYFFGFGAGILGGAYNTNGPPIILYGMLDRWSPEQFRATLQGYFVPTGLFILAGHALGGLWTAEVLWLYAVSLPAVVLAFVLGNHLKRRIPPGRFDRVVYVALVMMGVFLLL